MILGGREKCLAIVSFTGLIFVILTLVLALYGFPLIIYHELQEQLVIKQNGPAWDRFVELPIPMKFNVYFFEVENDEEVEAEKHIPKVKDNGPFSLVLNRRKRNITFDGDYVNFYQDQFYDFAIDTKNGKSFDHEVTITNPVLLGMYQILEGATAMPFDIDVVLLEIFDKELNKIFYKQPVTKLLLDGIKFCEPGKLSFQGNFVCLMVVLLNIKMITIHKDLSLSYSFFGFRNGKDDGLYKMHTGLHDIRQLGNVIEWNNMKYTNIWKKGNNECNKVQGKEPASLPPQNTKEPFKLFITDMCRTLDMEFYEEGIYRDIKTHNYRLSKNTFVHDNPSESCYCIEKTKGINGQNNCFMDGAIDIQSCLGIPGVVSHPHFLYGEHYNDHVKGLTPSFEMHGSEIKIEPFSGAPVQAKVRIQINIIMRPSTIMNDPVEKLKNLPNAAIPIAWLEQDISLEGDLYDMVTNNLYILQVVEIVQWVLVGIAALVFIIPGIIVTVTLLKRKNSHSNSNNNNVDINYN